MGTAERREREKEELRTRILEAARDILSEEGLDALSMRAIAERIEYSPATIYLYFRDKDDLIRTVVGEGFRIMGEYIRRALDDEDGSTGAMARYRALGRAYVGFALENTAYLNVMFELPRVAQMECPEPCDDDVPLTQDEVSWSLAVRSLEQAAEAGEIDLPNPFRGALIGWAMMHGLVALYVGGHLSEEIQSREAFEALVEEAMDTMYEGWSVGPSVKPVPAETGTEGGS